MSTILRKSLFISLILISVATMTDAQRVISGTVYMDGEPAAGVTVTANRSKDEMMTSFDGKYEITIDEKTKFIEFTFITDSKRLDIEGETGNVFDFAFTGELPSGSVEGDDVSLKSQEELIAEQNTDFMTEYTLYNDFYEQDEFDKAMPHWEILYNKFPRSTKNIYIQGVRIYEDKYDNAPNLEQKERFLNDMMDVYDNRVEHFSEEGYVRGRQGIKWFEKINDIRDQLDEQRQIEFSKRGYQLLEQSIDLQGVETEPPVLAVFMQQTVFLYREGELSKENVVQNYDLCSNLLNQIEASGNEDINPETVAQSKSAVDDYFSISGAADCETLINIYTPQFAEKSDDIEFLKNMLQKLTQQRCQSSDLFADASEKLYEMEPSAEAAFNMAQLFIRNEDNERAKQYLIDAIDQETDNELLQKYYYTYAVFLFSVEKANQEARSYAKKAIDLNSNYCEAYMLIGNIYASASSGFSNDDFEKSTVFWVAVDYFVKARSVSDECAAEASERISTYSRYFPNSEEGFFQGLAEGSDYTVGGWINEKTTVRY